MLWVTAFLYSVFLIAANAREKGNFSIEHCFPVPTPSSAGNLYPSPVFNTFQTERILSIAPSAYLAPAQPAADDNESNHTNYTLPEVVFGEQPRGFGLIGVGGGGGGGGGDGGGGGGGDGFRGPWSRLTSFIYWKHNGLLPFDFDQLMISFRSFVDNLQVRLAKDLAETMNTILFGEYVEASDDDIAKNVQFMELNWPEQSIDQQSNAGDNNRSTNVSWIVQASDIVPTGNI